MLFVRNTSLLLGIDCGILYNIDREMEVLHMPRRRRRRNKNKWLLYLLPLVLLVVVGAVACLVIPKEPEYRMSMQLSGERVLTVECGTEFKDPGATATIKNLTKGTSATAKVTVTGSVDTNKLGQYELSYKAAQNGRVSTDYRRVCVVDTQAPVITLVADPEKYTLPGATYEEEGFTATDNYDGDITALVVRTETPETVEYTVTDSSGNTTTVVRTLVYNDPIAPELSLLGKESVTVVEGNTYKEPGYTASDNCDGDLTAAVVVTGTVDTKKPGEYVLTYTVSDSYQNTVSLTRTVVVKKRPQDLVNDPATGEKVIYLTFDDGPGPHTGRLLDILKKYNVKATFFVVNTAYIDLVGRAAEEGHAIAVHSATHKFSQIYASEEAYFQDFYKMQEIIEKHTGITTNLFRFPGGSSNTVSCFNPGIMTQLAISSAEKGLVYFDWNVDSDDAGRASSASEVYRNVINGVKNRKNSVVLMHDIKKYTVNAIEDIITWGLENGYTFRALTEEGPTCHHGINN